jgi:uroporphyrinogen decarboxylase
MIRKQGPASPDSILKIRLAEPYGNPILVGNGDDDTHTPIPANRCTAGFFDQLAPIRRTAPTPPQDSPTDHWSAHETKAIFVLQVGRLARSVLVRLANQSTRRPGMTTQLPFRRPEEGWPVAMWRHHPERDQDESALVEATLSFQQHFDFDLVKVTPAGTYQAVDHGLLDAWQNDPLGRRTIVGNVIRSPADWDTISTSNALGPSTSLVMEAAARVRACTDPAVPVVVSVFSPMTQAIQLAGYETVLWHAQEAPAQLRLGLERIAQQTVSLIEQLFLSRLNGVYFAAQHMAAAFFTRMDYERLALDADLACLRAAEVMSGNVFHAHGHEIYLAPRLNPDRWSLHYEQCPLNPSLEDMLAAFGGPLFLGIAPENLVEMAETPDTVENYLLDLRKRLRGRVACLSIGCVLPQDFPDASIFEWVRIARSAAAP